MFGRSVALVGVAFLLALPAVRAQGQEEFKDEIRKLLNEGIDLYKQGKYKEAHAKLEEAFQKKPDSDLVYAFMKRAGDDIVASMMNAPDEQIKADGYRLFELSKPGETIRRSKKDVLKYLEDLKSNDHAIQRNAHWHLKHFSPWDLRFIIPVLANVQQDIYRSRLILLLTEIGPEATHAVLECIESANNDDASTLMKQNACIILGNIKDDRALPYLKRMSEEANTKPEVKKFANEALLKITRKTSLDQLKNYKEYFFELAEKYYYGHSSVVHAWSRSYLVWRWNDERNTITEREVPRFAWNEQMAEETLYDLLKSDPDYVHPTKGSPWALLACVHYAQHLEADAGVTAAETALKGGEPGLKESDVANLKTWLADANRHNVLASVPGKKYIYEALKRSLDDGTHLVAKAAIETIKEMGRPEDLPDVNAGGAVSAQGPMGWPLINALTSDDKRVRYSASEAMVRINPQTRKLGMELVIPNLVDAVGEQGVRVALIIYDVQDDADRNFVNSLRKLLFKINIFPVVATSGDEGIIKAKQFPTEDVIIVQKKIASQIYFRETETRKRVVETVFDTLRDDVRTKFIPRVVLAEGADLEAAKKEYDLTAQAFLDSTVIGQAGGHLVVNGILDKLWDSAEAKKDSKDRADLIAKSAAETFASIDVTNTLYPFRDAVDALIKTVSPEILRENFIRIPAARALGHFGDQRAIDVLSKVLNEKGANDEATKAAKGVRWACGRALSDIFRVTSYTPSNDNYGIYKKNVVDGDYDIELVVGEAIGNAQLTNAQRLDYENTRRVNDKRPVKTPEDE